MQSHSTFYRNQFASHIENQPLICVCHPVEELQQLLPWWAESGALRDLGSRGFSFTHEEDLVKLNLQRLGPLLQGTKTWHRVAVLSPRDVAAGQTRSLLNVALRECFGVAQFA